MDYNEALRYLSNFTDYEKKTGYSYTAETFDLRRTEALLAHLGNPHLQFPSVLVAGTKGKGSTSIMIASIIQASGLRVGLYSQPHLHTFRERMRVNGRLISREELAEAVSAVIPAVDQLQRDRPDLGIPTAYEATTAAAMYFFASQQPDLVVLEIGLGGRLDAANVVTPLVSVLAPISLDHIQILGDTIAQIAVEKAGIIKEKGTVVATDQTEEAIHVIQQTAAERSARLVIARPEIANGPLDATVRAPMQQERSATGENGRAHPRRERTSAALKGPSGQIYRVELPLLGDHQLANAATAIAVAEELAAKGFPITREAVELGLGQVRWPGRLEILNREPLVLADGAHNGDSATKLVAALRKEFVYRQLILVLATSSDKDVEGIVAALAPAASVVITTRSHHPRAAQPERLAAAIPPSVCPHVEIAADFASAIGLAIALAAPSDLICVAGSLFIVANAREHFGLETQRD